MAYAEISMTHKMVVDYQAEERGRRAVESLLAAYNGAMTPYPQWVIYDWRFLQNRLVSLANRRSGDPWIVNQPRG